jgi:hypothetical protein
MQKPDNLLPPGLAIQVEQATGAALVSVTPRGGGGASREGAELQLLLPDGEQLHAYMNYDVLRAGAGDDAAFLREVAILQALSGPLKDSGVRAARFIAAIPESRALIGRFVPGDADFNKLKSPQDRRATAFDFMAQLAKLHAIDVDRSPVEGMGPLAPPSVQIRERLAVLRQRAREEGDDPLITLALDWMDRNVPPDPDRLVIVHGDAGPANFLFEANTVTALLDWELVHYGDPMADLAMLCLRNLFQPFIPLPEAFAAYEAAGGAHVDLARVRYYRLFFEAGFASRARYSDPAAPAPPNFGMNLVYSTIHRRSLSEALAEAAGVELQKIELPSPPPGPRERTFDLALADLREAIVPRIVDQQASAKAKGLARLIKWWRDNDRFGEAFRDQELTELSAALGAAFATPEAGRAAFVAAVQAHDIDDATAMQLCHAQATRDAALLADAMGALANTRFAALEGATR